MLLRSWWVLVIRGVFVVLFGLLIALWPDITVFALVTIFAALTFLDGLTEVWVGFANRGREPLWWPDALLGGVSIVTGVAVLAWADISSRQLMVVIAIWMLVLGGVMTYQGYRLREDIAGELWVLATGAIILVAGLLLLIVPGADATGLAWLVGLLITLLGVLLIKIGWGIGRIERNLRAEVIRQSGPR